MDNTQIDIPKDMDAISRIPVVESILEVVCRSTGMGFAAIARVNADRWVACAVKDEINFGLVPGGELKIETTICSEIEKDRTTVVIDHVAEDERFSTHHTPAMYGFQSYISTPIILKDGRFFGTLCAIDPNPAKLNSPEVIGMFKLFAELIAFHLHGIEQIEISQVRLQEEQRTAELREQFIAVLGHDLRNPIGAISNSAALLQRMPLEERAIRLSTIIQNSAFRITGLIENVLDFARGRLGGGITLKLEPEMSLDSTMENVITELRAIWPNRQIDTRFDLKGAITCDERRIAQLFSNILGNALTYSPVDKPVLVEAFTEDGEFKLKVSNSGVKISPAVLERLFQPFSRGEVEKHTEGLGLGLYIAWEIAHAHGGILQVSSTEEQTCFTLILPQN